MQWVGPDDSGDDAPATEGDGWVVVEITETPSGDEVEIINWTDDD